MVERQDRNRRNAIITTPYLPTLESVQLGEALADAVVLGWNDMISEPTSGSIHVEYHVGALGSVEFLNVWAFTIRGGWKLICEHWMRPDGSPESGLRFANGYKSSALERVLGSIMQHQEIFLLGAAPGSDRMIQVHPPTYADRVAAGKTMGVFLDWLALSDSRVDILSLGA